MKPVFEEPRVSPMRNPPVSYQTPISTHGSGPAPSHQAMKPAHATVVSQQSRSPPKYVLGTREFDNIYHGNKEGSRFYNLLLRECSSGIVVVQRPQKRVESQSQALI